jgi:hypothetical protein
MGLWLWKLISIHSKHGLDKDMLWIPGVIRVVISVTLDSTIQNMADNLLAVFWNKTNFENEPWLVILKIYWYLVIWLQEEADNIGLWHSFWGL